MTASLGYSALARLCHQWVGLEKVRQLKALRDWDRSPLISVGCSRHSLTLRVPFRPLIQRCRLSTVALLAVLVSGCIILPVPTLKTERRYSSAQLEYLLKDAKTLIDVSEKLGSSDLGREGNRIWIYAWTVESGMLLALPLLPGPGPVGNLGPLHSEEFLLVFEFDADGALRNKDFAHRVEGGDKRYCTDKQVCIEHKIAGRWSNDRLLYFLHNKYSAVTVNGKAKELFAQPALQPNECLLMIWPEKDWDKPGGLLSNPPPHGLALQIGRYSNVWLPAETFARIGLPAGTHRLTALNPFNAGYVDYPRLRNESAHSHSVSFECSSGEYLYLSIGASGMDRFSIILRKIDPITAQAVLAKMPQVLLP